MGWHALLEIVKEQKQEVEDARRTPLSACPDDGTPLEEHRGVLHCNFCGEVYRR
jgi:uncharacterized Zn finger protein (UPF0148 family)